MIRCVVRDKKRLMRRIVWNVYWRMNWCGINVVEVVMVGEMERFYDDNSPSDFLIPFVCNPSSSSVALFFYSYTSEVVVTMQLTALTNNGLCLKRSFSRNVQVSHQCIN